MPEMQMMRCMSLTGKNSVVKGLPLSMHVCAPEEVEEAVVVVAAAEEEEEWGGADTMIASVVVVHVMTVEVLHQ